MEYDFGENVSFKGGFSIHLARHYQQLLGKSARFPIRRRAHNAELYFETDAVEAMDERLKGQGVEFLHTLREEPWGQRVLRVYDPDGHTVEIGEPMEAVIQRLHGQGMSVLEVARKTSMPVEIVERMV